MNYEIWIFGNNEFPFVRYDDIVTAVNMADALVRFKTNEQTSFKGELNEMQTEHLSALTQGNEWNEDITVFKNKYTIPLYFMNLILHKYGLEIKEIVQ